MVNDKRSEILKRFLKRLKKQLKKMYRQVGTGGILVFLMLANKMYFNIISQDRLFSINQS